MLKVGDTLGRYEVTGQLGEGGWGQVVRGRDATGGVEVAIKVALKGHPLARARFLREGRLAQRLAHANVVRVVEVGESDGTPFIAMELVSGAAMSGHLGSPRIPIQRRMDWLVQAARGLSAVHDAGLVHRDVKPANLMIMPDGVVKLIDFGFAKRVDADPASDALTERGAAVGTPAYMAPEQLDGSAIDHRVDQFAWGLVGFALVTGTRLRAVDPTLPPPDALRARLLEGGVSEAVAAVLLRAFRLPREERFASMREAGDALLAAIPSLAGERVDRVPVAGGERARWTFEVRAPDRPLALDLAHLRRDGVVIGLTPARRAFELTAGVRRELPPPPLPHVRCAVTSNDGALWVGADGGAAARLGPGEGVWAIVRAAEGQDSPLSAAAAPDGGVFLAGSRPGGGVVRMFSRRMEIARLETAEVVRAVVGTSDGRAFGVSGTTLFRTSGYGLSAIETRARGPLLAVAAAGDSVFAVGMGGAAIRYQSSRNTTTHDEAESRWDLAMVCAAGPAVAYAIAGHAEILRRDPASGVWEEIGGPFAPRRALAMAGDEVTVTVVLEDGAVVHGRRS